MTVTPGEANGPRRLNTERLRLRQIRAADAEDMFAFKGDPLVTTCYGQMPHRNVEETMAWILQRVPSRDVDDAILWAITLKEDGRVIGECCLWNIDRDLRCAEVGYELHPDYWRRGLATEAIQAVLKYGFEEVGLEVIEAKPLVRNASSVGLLRKLGFKESARRRMDPKDGAEEQFHLDLSKGVFSDQKR
jgi:ribosomal-protein-alanine N-acetyltransferase